ncbi:DUF6183 family protein [Embleya sp. MST-111070]|uniref:DUF6183 family protein n=1 Tax=Embleya sp. MST-111070 TaxID=3398231 RepID=UPI003F7409EA
MTDEGGRPAKTSSEDEVWRRRAENYPAALYELATGRRDHGVPHEILDPMLLLCTHHPSEAGVALVARLVDDLAEDGDPGDAPDFLVRRMARQLAQARGLTPRALMTLFGEPPLELGLAAEFRACLLQELTRISRIVPSGGPHDIWNAAWAYHARLVELGHPLAWLPLESYPFEHRLRRLDGSGGTIGMVDGVDAERNPPVPPTPSGGAAGRTAREPINPARTEAALAPILAIRQKEVRFFTVAAPLDQRDFNGALLSALPADCLVGTTPDTVHTLHITGDHVLGDLYIAADAGTAFGTRGLRPGQLGAYGRLNAWRGLYALMGLTDDVPFPEAIRYAAECRWLRFIVRPHENEWFADDAMDLGFVVLDADHTGIAILATSEVD